MVISNFLSEFSRHHCISICAFIVPTILLLTLGTIVLFITAKSQTTSTITASLSIILALIMLGHVFSWFSVGVVLGPSYILIALASVCLLINLAITTTRLVRTHKLSF
jgi:hypothetical membrane protein